MNHIELFAGCGGLTLGLERAGFELTLANELSPMAAETFSYNLLGEDLSVLADKGDLQKESYWLSSQYKDLKSRLRENPFEYPALGKGQMDIPNDPSDLNGKLIIGNIIHLNQYLDRNKKFLKALKGGFGRHGVDLVSGGPPCQSFSLAGLRKRDCDKNSLPWEFANFVEHVQPKFAVLENVTGILRAFKEDGIRYHAWFEIAKAFSSKGYIPLCLHINARLAGVPQNRPRFIMIGVHHKIYRKLVPTFNNSEEVLFTPAFNFYKKLKSGKNVILDDLPYFDVNRPAVLNLYRDSFLAPLINQNEISVKTAIGDLQFNHPQNKSSFIKILNRSFTNILGKAKKLQNHEPRNNNEHVRRRFRIYQVIQKCSLSTRKQVISILKLKVDKLTKNAWEELKNHKYLDKNGQYIKFKTSRAFINYLQKHSTKKQTQKALIASEPAPAALSIPDDACHYDEHELRTLTVREMARIQSFPDNFVFRSKITTGGKMRRFEVPQYTQVGNAVPPLLGFALGKAIKDLLERLE